MRAFVSHRVGNFRVGVSEHVRTNGRYYAAFAVGFVGFFVALALYVIVKSSIPR
jgi:hypothetical protein